MTTEGKVECPECSGLGCVLVCEEDGRTESEWGHDALVCMDDCAECGGHGVIIVGLNVYRP